MNSLDLNRLMNGFIHAPSEYVDRSWLEDILPEKVFAALSGNDRVKGRLNNFVIDRLNLGEMLQVTESGWREKFCVMPGGLLLSVFRRTALVQVSADLSKTISGEKIRHLKGALSEEDFAFVMNTAPLMITPELTETLPDDDGLRDDDFVLRGIGLMSQVWQSIPDALLNRVKVKLPVHYSAVFSSSAPENMNFDVRHLLSRIIRETSPQWRVIFD